MRGNSNRFYYKNENMGQDWLIVDDKELVRQWRKVMRFGEGDVVRLFDGSGWEYNYQFSISNFQFPNENAGEKVQNLELKTQSHNSKLKTNSLSLRLVDKRYFEDDGGRVVLGFGLMKHKERMEWMVEKCVELGVDEFVPMVTQNSQVKEIRNMARLEKIVVEACEQSGRGRVPGIITNYQLLITRGKKLTINNEQLTIEEGKKEKVVNFWMNLENRFHDYLKICWDGRGEKVDIKKLQEKIDEYDKKVLMVVGPEGGWSREELVFFRENGFEILAFHGDVLRAETAGVLGVGLVRQVMG